MLGRIILLATLLSVCAAAQTVRVPFHVGKGQRAVYVDVVVGGEVRHFIVDTGAHTTHIRPEVLGLKLNESSHLGDGNVGYVGDVQRIDNFEMKLGDTTYKFDVVASNMNVVRQYYKEIDGLLGQDFLSRFSRVTFDYKAHELILEQ